jgi:hypothetical protein
VSGENLSTSLNQCWQFQELNLKVSFQLLSVFLKWSAKASQGKVLDFEEWSLTILANILLQRANFVGF